MAVNVTLCPTFGVGYQSFTNGGLPNNAGLINTYIAGGTTPQATYTTSAGTVANANPIVLGVDGRPPSEIWLINGSSYRFDVTDSLGNLIRSYDNISNQSTAQFTLTSVSGTNTITGTATPTLSAYVVGQIFTGIAANTNTGATILNVSTLGGGAVQMAGVALVGGEIVQNAPFSVFVSAVTPVFQLIASGSFYPPPFIDTNALVKGSSDATKRVRFEVDGLTTATTRVWTAPDKDGTVAMTSDITSAATEVDQETASSTTVYVSPARQQFHPSACKGWLRSDFAGNILLSYNVASIVDAGTGRVTINWTVSFSSVNFASLMTVQSDAALFTTVATTNLGAGSAEFRSWNTAGTPTDGVAADAAVFGDQ